MNTLVHLNYVAIIVAALAYLGIGRLWYSKWFFGQAWLDAIKMEAPNNDTSVLITRILSALVLSFAMAMMVVLTGSSSEKAGLLLGLVTSIGLVGATNVINNTRQNQPTALLLINGGYQLAGCLVIAIIESLWRSV